jgi:membrane protease YdiL (CAAX protease family)
LDSTKGRALAALRVAVFVVAYVAALFLIGFFDRWLPPRVVNIALPLLSVFMPLALAVCFRIFWDRRPLKTLGLESVPSWGVEIGYGFAVGAILVTVIFLTVAAAGWLTWKVHFVGGMANLMFISVIFYLFTAALAVAFSEEFVFRGYILQNLLDDWGAVVAIAVSSILFGLGHLFNPGFNGLVAVNLTLAGAVMGYGVVIYKNLWWPIGFHVAWNFFEGPLYGMPVSGVSAASISLFITKMNGPAWLIGGKFGPEGGALATLALMAGLAGLWFVDRNRRSKADA